MFLIKLFFSIFFIAVFFLGNLEFSIAQANCKVSGGTFTQGPYGVNISGQTFDGTQLIISGCLNFRVTDNTFRNSNNGVVVRSSTGVIDDNRFENIKTYGVVVFADSDASWQQPLKLGMDGGIDLNGNGKYESTDAVYVEDNFFTNGKWHDIASNYGSRYVFRKNEVRNPNPNCKIGDPCSLPPKSIDAHGNWESGKRGSRSYEVYDNDFFEPARWTMIGMRGGDGIISDNRIVGDYRPRIRLENDDKGGPSCNTYPCKDQIRELYIWGNEWTDSSGTLITDQAAMLEIVQQNLIQKDRDYFLADPNTVHSRGLATGNYNYQVTSYQRFCYPHPLVSGVECNPGGSSCGNGIRETGEQCDDENLINGDGCSSSCTLENTGNPADLNNDQKVNILDILIIITNFGKESDFDPNADLNEDGKIDLLDILEVIKNWENL